MRVIGTGDVSRRRLRGIYPVFVAAIFALLLVAGCGGAGAAGTVDASEYPVRDIEIMAPADPGGGYDQTARLMERALSEGDVTDQNVEVYNVPGASGAIGLTEFVNDNRGDPHQMMIVGKILVGAIKRTDVPFTVNDTTPIARLAAEYDAILVPADSEYESLEQLVEDFKANPGSIVWGGGSAGGVDQILTGRLAQEAGVDPAEVNYIPYSGGGELATGLFSGDVTVGVSGLGEFEDQAEAGEVRLLAVSSEEPIEGVDVPTIVEAGYDVSLANWRGVVAPPDITEEQREAIIANVEQMHETSEWQEALSTNDWEDVFLTGDEFEAYLESEDEEAARVLEELGVI